MDERWGDPLSTEKRKILYKCFLKKQVDLRHMRKMSWTAVVLTLLLVTPSQGFTLSPNGALRPAGQLGQLGRGASPLAWAPRGRAYRDSRRTTLTAVLDIGGRLMGAIKALTGKKRIDAASIEVVLKDVKRALLDSVCFRMQHCLNCVSCRRLTMLPKPHHHHQDVNLAVANAIVSVNTLLSFLKLSPAVRFSDRSVRCGARE